MSNDECLLTLAVVCAIITAIISVWIALNLPK